MNSDGKLSQEECTEYIKDFCKKKNMTTEEFHKVVSFEDIDSNGDGYVSKQELHAFLQDWRMLHSEILDLNIPRRDSKQVA